jgi:hypothetical protein
VAAWSLVPVGADEPLRLAAALIAAHVHDHATRVQVFPDPPQIGVSSERALPQPARDIIACVRRELAGQGSPARLRTWSQIR